MAESHGFGAAGVQLLQATVMVCRPGSGEGATSPRATYSCGPSASGNCSPLTVKLSGDGTGAPSMVTATVPGRKPRVAGDTAASTKTGAPAGTSSSQERSASLPGGQGSGTGSTNVPPSRWLSSSPTEKKMAVAASPARRASPNWGASGGSTDASTRASVETSAGTSTGASAGASSGMSTGASAGLST